ncbi:MAG: bifunctional diguanylate cyclase/phosphodiesterase [Pseudomonadota bacterium]
MVKSVNIWIYVIGIISILLMISYLYVIFIKKEDEIKNSMISYQIETIQLQRNRIQSWLEESCQGDEKVLQCLLDDVNKSKSLNKLLSLVINQDIRYVFLVYQDIKGRYRFIADGADQPSKVMQKIDPDNKISWDESYSSSKHKIISSYQNTDKLWRTYLLPIIKNNKTHLMLVTDFSISLNDKIKKTIAPIKNILFYTIGVTILIFVIGIIQMLMYLYAKKESYTDELTTLWNRNYLRKLVDSKFNYNHYVIVIVDIDFFKKINDQYGHDIGDIVLKEISNLFVNSIDKNDFVFRYGGEEFLFLLQNDTYSETLNTLMHGVRKLVIKVPNYSIDIKISAGVNRDLHQYKNFSDMVKSADIALYNAKMNGRDRIVYYSDSIDKKAKTNFQTVQAALDENRIFCEYHAIIDISSNKIFKYEALVRIKETNGTVLYPDSFLDVIKNTNIYTDLTKRVIDITTNKFLNLTDQQFSINLGLQDFNNKEIINYLLEVIDENPKLLDLMNIEVLENDKVDNEKNCIDVINILQNRGLQIALDDFGSGYANFSTILSYQFDIIKIDGVIVQKVVEDVKAKKIIASIVDFAQAHQMIVICEFVSSKEIAEILESIGVRYMQGFYFYKPQLELN